MPNLLRRTAYPVKAATHRGVGFSGLEFAPGTLPGTESTNYTQNTAADYLYAALLGITIVRVAFLWERLQPTVGGSLDSTYKGYLDNNVNWAAAAGVKVLFECHNFGGRDVSGTPRKVGDAQLTTANFADMWSRIATAYSGNATVWGYDLMNEPSGMPVPTTSSNYNTTSSALLMNQAGITAIRLVDTSKYIVCEADNYSGLQNFTGDYGTNPTPWFTDSANKLYYSWHYYFDSDHSGAYSGANVSLSGSGQTVNAGADYLKTVCDWGVTRGVNILIGEVGVINNESGYESALSYFYRISEQYPTCIVFHWAMGNWYTSATTLEPTNNYTTPRSQDINVVRFHTGTSTP